MTEIEIISSFGQHIASYDNINSSYYQLNIFELESNQAYLTKITLATGEIIIEKFLKL